MAVWTDSLRAQQLCSYDTLSLQKGLTLVTYGGKPQFGMGEGGTETWNNTRYMADCGDSSIAHIPSHVSSSPQTLEMMFKS